ncbi:MAG: nitrogenase component 1 [Firmicutes bacterium]|nr:nitrogenase component 1 [Bacillota bacterium]
MLLKNQTSSIISTYAADVSGVCSALFEMGGMTVMHDASGCNSTYNTHDEPRWYDTDSMVFISALTETEAIMGNDNKLIGDIIDAACQLSPEFIAIAGTPIPMITGTDFSAVARVVEAQTGIPSFGFDTNGMHSYLLGASAAFTAIAEHMVDTDLEKSKNLSVNILGTTPLDFSVNSYLGSVNAWLAAQGFEIIGKWGVGARLCDIRRAKSAHVNLVMSSCGLEAARTLRRRFGTPYVIGIPINGKFSDSLAFALKSAATTGECEKAYHTDGGSDTIIIGEAVAAGCIKDAAYKKYGIKMHVLCPPDTDYEVLPCDSQALGGENITRRILASAKRIIADPLYMPICPETAEFIPLPHEAFSGRIFRESIPDLMKTF